MKKAIPSLLLVSLLMGAGQLAAQQAPKPAPASVQQQQLTPEQQAQVAKQDAEISKAAAGIVQLVDTGKLTDVWNLSSAVVKGVVGRDDFVRQVGSDRQKLGAPGERKQVAVTRAAYAAGGPVPAGNYLNVVYATKFANVAEPIRELVSFRLDDDKVWRLSGYSLRAEQPAEQK